MTTLELDTASAYFERRLTLARQASLAPAEVQFDLARSPLTDDELEAAVDKFRDSPEERVGWGMSTMLQEVLSTEPRAIPVKDLKALQERLVAAGYVSPDMEATGEWDESWYSGFRRAEWDKRQQVMSGNHWGAVDLETGLRALSYMLPASVLQGVVGAAKGIVLQTGETFERGGALGGAAAGAGIGAGLGSVVPGVGTALGALGGGVIGGAAGFLSDLFGEDEGEQDQGVTERLIDALSPFEEYSRDGGAQAFFEDLGYVLSAASMIKGIGVGAAGVSRGIGAVGTEMAAGRSLGQAMLANPGQQLGIMGGLTKNLLGKALPGSKAAIQTSLLRTSPFAFAQRLGPQVAVKAFGGLAQAQMGARIFGGLGGGGREKFLTARSAMELELGRDLTLEEETELREKTATTTIEQEIAKAPTFLTGINADLPGTWGVFGMDLSNLGDLSNLAAFVIYPERMLPFSGKATAKGINQSILGLTDNSTRTIEYAHAIQHQNPKMGFRKAVNWVKENISPHKDAYMRLDYGLDRVAYDTVREARASIRNVRQGDIRKARADTVRTIRNELDAGDSPTLERALRYSMEDPTDFGGWLIGLNRRDSGLDKIQNYWEANRLARQIESHARGTALPPTPGKTPGLPKDVRLSTARTERPFHSDLMAIDTELNRLDGLIAKADRAANRNAHLPAGQQLLVEQGIRFRRQVADLKAKRRELRRLGAESRTKRDSLDHRVGIATLDFVDRDQYFAYAESYRDFAKRRTAAQGPQRDMLNVEFRNFLEDLEGKGLIDERDMINALKKEKPSDKIARDLMEQGESAARPLHLRDKDMTEFERLGYKPVEAGDDFIFPDQLDEIVNVESFGPGDVGKLAGFWETAGLSIRNRADIDLAKLRRQHTMSELETVFQKHGIKISPERALARINATKEELNHRRGVNWGPFTIRSRAEGGLGLYKVDVRDLSVDEISLALGDVTGVTDDVAMEVFGAMRRGAAMGGEFTLKRPGETLNALGRALRINGFVGFSDMVRTLHSKVERRLPTPKDPGWQYRPVAELAQAPQRARAMRAIDEVVNRNGMAGNLGDFEKLKLDALAMGQVRAGRWNSVDEFYRDLDVAYAERYVADTTDQLFKGLDEAYPNVTEGLWSDSTIKVWLRGFSDLKPKRLSESGRKLGNGVEEFIGPEAARVFDTKYSVGTRYFGVRRDGKVVGVASLQRDTLSVAVHPDYRRQGLATALYREMEKEGLPVRKYTGKGSTVSPQGRAFSEAYRRGQDPLFKRVEAAPSMRNLLKRFDNFADTKDWYKTSADTINELFAGAGMVKLRDGTVTSASEIVRNIMAATSPLRNPTENFAAAMKVFRSYLRGDDISGGELPNVVKMVDDILDGNTINKWTQPIKTTKKGAPSASRSRMKVWNFYHNLRGELDNVTVDTWMARLFGIEGLTPKEYDEIADAIKAVAKRRGVFPAEAQAALWASVKEEAAEIAEKAGNKRLARAVRNAGGFAEAFTDNPKVQMAVEGALDDLNGYALLQRVEDEILGATSFGPDFPVTMRFFRGANFGTLIHEDAHLLRKLLAPEDVLALERHYGVEAPAGPVERVKVTIGKRFDERGAEIHRRTIEEGGSTWDPRTGDFVAGGEPGAGFAVAVEEGTAKLISPDNLAFRDANAFTAELKRFAREKRETLTNPRMKIGTWKDDEGIHLDVSEVVGDRGEAIRLGAQRQQKAVFDLERFEDIDTANVTGVWTREMEERFAEDAERFFSGKLGQDPPAGLRVLKDAVGALYQQVRPVGLETNLIPREARKVFDAYYPEAMRALPDGARTRILKSVGSKQVVGGAAIGAGVGAVEGDGFEDVIQGAMVGAGAGLVSRSALRRTYGYLPDYLTRVNSALRYTLSFTFDMGRYVEQNQIGYQKHRLTPMLSPKKATIARSAQGNKTPYGASVSGEETWAHATRLWDEINGTDFYATLDDIDRRMFQRGMLGFSPRNFEIAQAWQLYQRGMGTDDIVKAVAEISRYGLGRTAAEKSANFIFFPFSFSKKMLLSLGDFMLQAPGRNLLLQEGLRRYHESEFDERLEGIIQKHLPLLEDLKRINNLAFGISPGRFFLEGMRDHRTGSAGIAQALASVFVPSGAATPIAQAAGGLADVVINGFTPVVITGESFGRAGGIDSMNDIVRRYIPFVREVDEYLADTSGGFQAQIKAFMEGAAPDYQYQAYVDGIKGAKSEYEPMATALGYSSVDGFLSSDIGAAFDAQIEERKLALAEKYPTGLQMASKFETSDRIDARALADLGEKKARGQTSEAEDHILAIREEIERWEVLAGILNMDAGLRDTFASHEVRRLASQWATDRRFGELWDRFFLRNYGPIRRVA